MAPTTYRVRLERDESSSWIARVPSVPGCHTYGRSIEQALARTRQALSLWVDDADDAYLEPDVQVPAQIRRVATEGKRARARAEQAQETARRVMVTSARTLTRAGFSRRDAATLLGVSHQRVQQLLADG